MLRNQRILIIDDDETLCYLLKEELINEGFIVDISYNGNGSFIKLKENKYDLVLLDLEMKEITGEEILQKIKAEFPETEVIVLTAKTEIRTAIQCIQMGAFDFITKPYEFDQLLKSIDRAIKEENEVLRMEIAQSTFHKEQKSERIIGKSEEIQKLFRMTEKAAASDANILLEGETGTGKELFSEFIHKNSPRRFKPFVAINCSSLPDQLIESELFGYEKGAFTDAKNSKPGLVEIANGGTLFLDEISELSLSLQPKLLRFLENGEYRRIGGLSTLTSNVRIIAATNKNLFEETERKRFRRDLLFRLNVITLTLPPLRKRGADILLIADFFLSRKTNKKKKVLSETAKKILLKYSFPGNVRELHHIIERAVIFSEDDIISAEDLNLPKNYTEQDECFFDADGNILTMDIIEEKLIRTALDKYNWNRENTSRALGISQKTLYSKIKKYNITK